MRLGRRSLLFGCHQFALHPIFVLVAWVKVYRPDNPLAFILHPPRLLAALVHDWGYWFCHTMDGADGRSHPSFGASLVLRLTKSDYWWAEVLLHSRFYAGLLDKAPSNMCWVDKLSTALYPSWLWATLAYLSGEGWEYMEDTRYEIHRPSDRRTWVCLWKFHQRFRSWTLQAMKSYGWEVD